RPEYVPRDWTTPRVERTVPGGRLSASRARRMAADGLRMPDPRRKSNMAQTLPFRRGPLPAVARLSVLALQDVDAGGIHHERDRAGATGRGRIGQAARDRPGQVEILVLRQALAVPHRNVEGEADRPAALGLGRREAADVRRIAGGGPAGAVHPPVAM